MNNPIEFSMLVLLMAAGVRLATPLIFAALGGIICERSGVTNIGLEGMMIMGTFGAYVGAFLTGNAWGGALGGVLAGAATALLFAYMALRFRADQVVLGTGVNILALALTAFIYRAMYKGGISQFVTGFEVWNVPLLSDIPGIGPIFFQQIPLVYVCYVLIALIAFILYRTTWGLKLRSVGELPRAADTAGISVAHMRYIAVTISGALAGLGGAFLSIGEISAFTEGLVSGRGFIALAAVIFGRWDPLRVAAACLLFGTADALQYRMQALKVPIPYEFLLMLPYVLTLVAFILFVHRSRPPAALGKPYPDSQD